MLLNSCSLALKHYQINMHDRIWHMIELDDRGLPPFMFGLKRRVGDRHQDCPDLGAVGKKIFLIMTIRTGIRKQVIALSWKKLMRTQFIALVWDFKRWARETSDCLSMEWICEGMRFAPFQATCDDHGEDDVTVIWSELEREWGVAPFWAMSGYNLKTLARRGLEDCLIGTMKDEHQRTSDSSSLK